MSMLFIGETRFSLFEPRSTSWVASNGSSFISDDKYKDYLFGTERLELRSNIFINYCLPILEQGSKDFDYIHVLSYSDSLPEKFEKKLVAAAIDYPFILLDKHSNGAVELDVAKLAYDHLAGTNDEFMVFGHFRLDDDDLLSVDYFKDCSRYLSEDFVGFVVSFGQGATLLYENGSFYNSRVMRSPLNSMGQMRICSIDSNASYRGPVTAPHNQVDLYSPVILDSRGLSFLCVRHVGQDTSLLVRSSAHSIELARITRELEKYPSFSNHEVLSHAFPTLICENLDAIPTLTTNSISKSDLSASPASIPVLGAHGRPFILSGRLFRSISVTANKVLVRILVKDLRSQEVSNFQDIVDALGKQGFILSANRSIGFFRYIICEKESTKFRFIVELPEWLLCTELIVMNWGVDSAVNTVEGLELSTFE